MKALVMKVLLVLGALSLVLLLCKLFFVIHFLEYLVPHPPPRRPLLAGRAQPPTDAPIKIHTFTVVPDNKSYVAAAPAPGRSKRIASNIRG